MTFAELSKTTAFCVLFEMQYHFVFHRLGAGREDLTFTVGPVFSGLVHQAGEYWGRFEGEIHTSANGDSRGPTTGIFRVHIPRELTGTPEEILAGAEFSVKIETAPGQIIA